MRMQNLTPQHRVVTKRLHSFFAHLTTQLAAGAAEIWHTVEQLSAGSGINAADPRPPHIAHPMEQQPLQQQQAKCHDAEQSDPARPQKKMKFA